MAHSSLHWNACHIPQNFIVSLRKPFPLHILYASWKNYYFKFDSNWYSAGSNKPSLAGFPSCAVFPWPASWPQSKFSGTRIETIEGCSKCRKIVFVVRWIMMSNSSSISLYVSRWKSSNWDFKAFFSSMHSKFLRQDRVTPTPKPCSYVSTPILGWQRSV